MVYKVEIIGVAQKQMLALPRPAQLEIAGGIDQLTKNPRPSGCKKLRATELWRLRIGRYRVIYHIADKDKLITIIKVALRREDTYRLNK